MRRRHCLLAVVSVLALLGLPAHAEKQRPLLTLTGQGGQTATLVVDSGPLTLAPDRFEHPRLAGGDGAVGGFIVQRGERVIGGVVLVNAPGISTAVALTLGSGDLRLSKGRYRVTLLGSVRQTASMVVSSGQPGRKLQAAGPARPITRSFSGNGSPLHQWSHRLGEIRAGDTLVLGSGSTGDPAAHAAQICLSKGDAAPTGPCLGTGPLRFHSGGAFYTALTQTMPTDQGPMVYSGQMQTAGLRTRAGYMAMVISLRP